MLLDRIKEVIKMTNSIYVKGWQCQKCGRIYSDSVIADRCCDKEWVDTNGI